MAFLPPYLLNIWRMQRRDEERARNAVELKGWTSSSLAEFQMKYQLEKLSHSTNDGTHTPSLSSIAIMKTLETLQSSEDLLTDARIIAESLGSTLLRQLLEDPRTPYRVLRVFKCLPQTSIGQKRRIIDVDEAIIKNERHIRGRGQSNVDGKHLIGLEDFCGMLSGNNSVDNPAKMTRSKDKKILKFTRRDPPRGGLEVLDYCRKRQLSINSHDATFCEVFDRITKGILDGLDWTNVMVAGGMALATLLHTDPTKDGDRRIRDPDIDLYIYGLGPEDANRKAEEIHDTWVENLPSSASTKLVVKNAKTINLLTSYPNRRIQIVLKLPPTPTDVLLNFDLDACAIGFDGSRVFMLPRCARAIETGYSVFTMELVWGHHLGDRRASQDTRILKYADRGFGVRFLPSYARSLEEEKLEQLIPSLNLTTPVANEMNEVDRGHEYYRWYQRNRKPYGHEPGLKTLKRIAYLGRNYVHQFYFGTSPLSISPEQIRKQLESERIDYAFTSLDRDPDDENYSGEEEEIWLEQYNENERENKRVQEANDRRRAKNKTCEGPLMRLSELDTETLHTGLPDGRRGLGNLEIFMRHCEAWRLHARADATLDMSQTSSLAYDPGTYDSLPDYEWSEQFDVDKFARVIENYNDNLWALMKEAICGKLGIPITVNGYAGYSTRRIRRQVYGPNIQAVQAKQITIPVNVPFGLENFLLTSLPQEYDNLPSHFTDFKPLIPIHDPSKYSRNRAHLPSLQDTAAENGNLRYWIITNESMWASQHRVLDEFAELMWCQFHWFVQAMSTGPFTGVRTLEDNSLSCWHFARSFRRRIVLSELPSNQPEPVAKRPDIPSLRETLLFKPWAFLSPAKPDREFQYTEDGDPGHELFEEEAVRYPFDDSLFWDSSDEGMWDEEGVPEWMEVPA